MKALLKTYTLDTLTETEVVEIPENYDGDPYGDTVPFSVGSNQSLEALELSELLPADQVPWPHPDCADLNDWMFEHANEVFEATRYLAVNQYDLALSLWHRAGRPTEGFESALWTKEEALG